MTVVDGGGAGLVAALVAPPIARRSAARARRPAWSGSGHRRRGYSGARWHGGREACARATAVRLGAAVYVITFASFLMLGARGLSCFRRDWLPLLIVSVIGIGGFTRLFVDVVSAQAAERPASVIGKRIESHFTPGFP